MEGQSRYLFLFGQIEAMKSYLNMRQYETQYQYEIDFIYGRILLHFISTNPPLIGGNDVTLLSPIALECGQFELLIFSSDD